MADKATGTQSYLIINQNLIPITKYTSSADRKMADTTDTSNYDPQSGLIWPSQLDVSATIDVAVEFKYSRSRTPSGVMTPCFTNSGPFPVTLGLDAGTIIGSGMANMTNLKIDVPYDDTVTGTCNLKANGVWQFG